MNSTFLPIWPTNTTRETNDAYENYANFQEEQQTILNHQRQGEQTENNPHTIHYSKTRQMGDNITSNNEQRQHTGGGGGNGACASNVVSRKKTNNGKEKQIIEKFSFEFSNRWRW